MQENCVMRPEGKNVLEKEISLWCVIAASGRDVQQQ